MKYITILLLIFLVGCSTVEVSTIEETESNDEMSNEETTIEGPRPEDAVEEPKLKDWLNYGLIDVKTKEKYMLSDFDVVLLESFAVWCPTCKKQQDVLKELHEESDVVSIGLNTDPNEDEEQVLNHVNKNGYDWRFSISPIELTERLVDEFGLSIVNAPGAPIVLICNNKATLLRRGVKSKEELLEEIAKC